MKPISCVFHASVLLLQNGQLQHVFEANRNKNGQTESSFVSSMARYGSITSSKSTAESASAHDSSYAIWVGLANGVLRCYNERGTALLAERADHVGAFRFPAHEQLRCPLSKDPMLWLLMQVPCDASNAPTTSCTAAQTTGQSQNEVLWFVSGDGCCFVCLMLCFRKIIANVHVGRSSDQEAGTQWDN
jgi:hypothetical protein